MELTDLVFHAQFLSHRPENGQGLPLPYLHDIPGLRRGSYPYDYECEWGRFKYKYVLSAYLFTPHNGQVPPGWERYDLQTPIQPMSAVIDHARCLATVKTKDREIVLQDVPVGESPYNLLQQVNAALSQHLCRQTTQQQELLKRLITAHEDERKRVARGLHDELGQSLSGLALHSEAIEKFIHSDPERTLDQLSLIRELIDETTQQMYELIMALRPSALDDLGLVVSLRSYAERLFKRSGITFQMDSSGLVKRLPPSIETALYRIFQEALSNVLRHAGANHVKITLAQRDGVFEGEIVDNGHGFNPHNIDWEVNCPHGLGLLGMQERVSQCGGSMEIISRQGEGTYIRIHISLVETDDE